MHHPTGEKYRNPEKGNEGFLSVVCPKIGSQERQQDAHHDSR
jgi:hypothetical protein